jgi:hypothetical protein
MMAKFKTLDDVEVTATSGEVTSDEGVIHKIWTIKFPNGETREMHDSAFADNFKEVKK